MLYHVVELVSIPDCLFFEKRAWNCVKLGLILDPRLIAVFSPIASRKLRNAASDGSYEEGKLPKLGLLKYTYCYSAFFSLPLRSLVLPPSPSLSLSHSPTPSLPPSLPPSSFITFLLFLTYLHHTHSSGFGQKGCRCCKCRQ